MKDQKRNNIKSFKNEYRTIIFFIMVLIGSFGILSFSSTQEKVKKKEGKMTTAEALQKVVKANNLDKLKAMVEEHNFDINEELKNKESALTLAAYFGHTEMASYLLDKGANIKARNKWDNTPFCNACMSGHDDIAQMILKKGVDINEKGEDGFTALHFAVQRNHPSTVKFLLENGAKIDIKSDYGAPPIMVASWEGNPEIINMLAEKGADLNFKNKNTSVLHNLASSGNAKSVKIALMHGADANTLNSEGMLPIHNAAMNGHAKAAYILAQETKNINIKGSNLGNTPLHIAAINGDLKTTKVLIEAKADAEVVNMNGKKPLDYAIQYGYVDLVTLFAEADIATKKDIKMAEKSREMAKSEMDNGQAKIIYTGHSGWIVQTENSIMVFDYWDRSKNKDKCMANGGLCPKDLNGKNLYVFVSHDHNDHFDTTIYEWANEVKNITYAYGFRPEKSWVYKKKTYTGPAYTYIDNNTTQKVNDLKVTAIKSNDTGQGFLVEADGIKIFHPGDHALFTKEDKPVFTKEIDYIADQVGSVDFAFLPVSGCPSRWKKEYIAEGFFYTIDKLQPKQVFPMHAFNSEYNLKEFAEMAEKKKCKSNVLCSENRGDRFIYSQNFTASK